MKWRLILNERKASPITRGWLTLILILLTLISSSVMGQNYPSTIIGQQEWMTENLDVSKFRNGDVILEAKTQAEWLRAAELKIPAWCYYNNDSRNGYKYGKLYNGWAVIDPRELAPVGWRVSSIYDWEEMVEWDGYPNFIAYGLKTAFGCDGSNVSGFSAVPGGKRGLREFEGEGEYTGWWAWSKRNAIYAPIIYCDVFFGEEEDNPFNFDGKIMNMKDAINHGYGFYVRCIKD